MDQPVQYCENCGKALSANARFCGRCGTPVDPQPVVAPEPVQARPPIAAPPAPPAPAAPRQVVPPPSPPPPVNPAPANIPPQPAASPAEIIAGVIPAAYRRKGALGLSTENFTLVVTNYRIIFALQTAQMLQEQARLAKEEAKQQGKGFFGQWGAMLGSGYGRRYLNMQPQAILAEQAGNFCLMNNQINSVKFHVVHFSSDIENKADDRIEFITATGKFNFSFTQLDHREAKQLLTQVLGKVVH